MLHGKNIDHKRYARDTLRLVRRAEAAVRQAPSGACTMRLNRYGQWAYLAGLAHAELLGARRYGLERKFREYHKKTDRALHIAVMQACDY